MDYVDVSRARGMPGLKLVLSAGVPGPWSEAIKQVLQYKKIPYIPVIQRPGEPNDDLVAWTGQRNAPAIVHDDEPILTRWLDMVWYAERLAPERALIPADSEKRVAVLGILGELAGEWGYGWCRRLMSFKVTSAMRPEGEPPSRGWQQMVREYRISPEEWNIAPARAAGIIGMLSRRLLAQRGNGSRYLVGDTITAADIFWAAFSLQFDPLPADVNPMAAIWRDLFKVTDPLILGEADPVLLEHRDFIFNAHLSLPLDF